eukprot:TRINITY_DN89620_c0_g1_i1.p1 TRINITY_DN89620_c0_g1~~TRINITY_DN89620_c0_g1_i1.p1  ORF type:complete len:600 (-),score=85.29 TRINITY_DN89620_c0_g1_i1:120-1685(-)
MKGAVQHTGDETAGIAGGMDEMIWVVLPRLPKPVKLLIFVIAASGEASLADAKDGMVHVVQESYGQTVCRFKLEKAMAGVDVIAMMEKTSAGVWKLYQVDEVADSGEHFLDILEPIIGDLIRKKVDNAPKHQRVAFTMKKGGVCDLPSSSFRRLNFCIEGNLKASSRKTMYLEISAIIMDERGSCLGACHVDNPKCMGIRHSGEDDCDEDVTLNLVMVPKRAFHIWIVVNLKSSTEGVSFSDLVGATCTVTDQNCQSVASLSLKSEGRSSDTGLILCRLQRQVGSWWELEAVGNRCPGPTWNEAIPILSRMITGEPADDEEIPEPEPSDASLPMKLRRRSKRANTSSSINSGVRVASALRDFEDRMDPFRDELEGIVPGERTLTEGREENASVQVRMQEEVMRSFTADSSVSVPTPAPRAHTVGADTEEELKSTTDCFPRYVTAPDESTTTGNTARRLRRQRTSSQSLLAEAESAGTAYQIQLKPLKSLTCIDRSDCRQIPEEVTEVDTCFGISRCQCFGS